MPANFMNASRGTRTRAAVVGAFALAGAVTLAATLSTTRATAGEPAAGMRPTVDRVALRELGRRLFFDAGATSRMGMRACADCHHPGHGFSDPARLSFDDVTTTQRHSQTLEDGADNPSGHWDGEFEKIDDLVKARLNVRFTFSGSQYGDGGGDSPAAVPALLSALSRASSPPIEAMLPSQFVSVSEGQFVTDGQLVQLRSLPGFVTQSGQEPEPEAGKDSNSDSRDVLPRTPTARDVFGPVGGAVGEPAPNPRPRQGLLRPTVPFVNSQQLVFRPLPDITDNRAIPARYAEAFRAAFGDVRVTERTIGLAVAEYCHSLKSGTSAYDRMKAGEADALSPEAKRGLALFEGKAGCAACHTLGGERAHFSDYRFHDTGVVWKGVESVVAQLKTPAPEVVRAVFAGADRGRAVRTRDNADVRAFKTPSLRDVARRGPYMHDGSLKTLADVVRHYTVVPRDPNLDAKFPRFSASDAEVKDLVAFLESLTGDERPGLAKGDWQRAAETRLVFVDGDGKPVAGLKVALVPAGDILPGFVKGEETARLLTTAEDGSITFTPGRSTHTKILLADTLRPVGGDLVPDTCKAANVELPLKGVATVAVIVAKDDPVPDTIVARHTSADVFPNREVPATVLHRRETTTDKDGTQRAIFEGTFRTDVGMMPADVRLMRHGAAVEQKVTLDAEKAVVLREPDKANVGVR